MSSNVPISGQEINAPTTQNTPLNQTPNAMGLSRPTIPDISEDNEQEDGENIIPDLYGTHAHLAWFKGRLAELIGKSSLPLEVRWSIEALKGLQAKQDELRPKLKHEMVELAKKSFDRTKPLYERRSAIINGKGVPTLQEIEAGAVYYSLEDGDIFVPPPEGSPLSAVAIPDFWFIVLRNCDLIKGRDEAALKHLTDIQCEYLNDSPDGENPGFRLTFAFSPNEFFDNEILTKIFILRDMEGPCGDGDFILDRAIGTEIKWKEDKDLTKEFEIKKQRSKNTNRTRLVRKARLTESFFNFFSPPTPMSEQIIEGLDEEEADEARKKFELDYHLGEYFQNYIIPHAVDYFTGENLQSVTMDEDEDKDSDSDEDEEPPRRRRPPKKTRRRQ